MENHPNLADYASFRLLLEFDPKKEGFVSKARFHKAMYELHTRLKKRKVDIHLPWRWYIYGPVVELDLIDPGIFSIVPYVSASQVNEDSARVFFDKEPTTTGLDKNTIAAINYETKKLRGEFLGTKKLIECAYDRAPIPFISVLRSFDEWIHRNPIQQNANFINELEGFKSSLVGKYPGQELPETSELNLRVLDLVKHYLMLEDEGQAAEVSSEYRKVMALGFSSRYFENIPMDRVMCYRSRFLSEAERLDSYLFSREFRLFSSLPTKEGPRSKELGMLLAASCQSRNEVL